MTTDQINDMLENRHTSILSWVDRRLGLGPELNVVPVIVGESAYVHDCINLQRQNYEPFKRSDAQLLADFIVDKQAKRIV